MGRFWLLGLFFKLAVSPISQIPEIKVIHNFIYLLLILLLYFNFYVFASAGLKKTVLTKILIGAHTVNGRFDWALS
jgi:hypothetical protein